MSGRFDVLVGVNLLREGLDIPDVSLVAILDADKEGFLRSDRALTQTAGRAARNLHGLVIMYADTITGSMRRTIEETERRRRKQQEYNLIHNITPTQIRNDRKNTLAPQQGRSEGVGYRVGVSEGSVSLLNDDPVVMKMSHKELTAAIEAARAKMEAAAKELDYLSAARYRDEMYQLMNLDK